MREHDSRGRHTTTHRALIQLPDGGCLIDTPGMRELKLTGDEDLVAATFADIDALALQCRFGDCAPRQRAGLRGARRARIGRARCRALGELSASCATNWPRRAMRSKRNSSARRMRACSNKALGKRLVDKYGRR